METSVHRRGCQKGDVCLCKVLGLLFSFPAHRIGPFVYDQAKKNLARGQLLIVFVGVGGFVFLDRRLETEFWGRNTVVAAGR
jgi:hypothetical protein